MVKNNYLFVLCGLFVMCQSIYADNCRSLYDNYYDCYPSQNDWYWEQQQAQPKQQAKPKWSASAAAKEFARKNAFKTTVKPSSQSVKSASATNKATSSPNSGAAAAPPAQQKAGPATFGNSNSATK